MTVSESGEHPERIRLISTDGQAWETWYYPFGDPAKWTDEAEQVVTQLAEDWPPQDIQLLFVAESKSGTIIAQCTKRTRGRMKGASGNVFGGPGKALADSMDAQARTMDRILATANTQLEMMATALTAQQAQNAALLQQIQLQKQMELEHQANNAPGVPPELMQQAVEMLPALIEVIFSKAPASNGAAAAATQAAAKVAANVVTNNQTPPE